MKKILSTLALAGFLTAIAGCDQQQNSSAAAPAAASTQDQQRAPGTVLLDVHTEDGKVPTTVGKVVAGKGLESTGTGGQLMFGPYAAMASGSYKVTIHGEFEGDEPAKPLVFDVAYGQGVSVAKSVDVATADARNGTLASFEFTLPQPVTDLEIRARVAEGAHVLVKGYQVVVE